VQSDSFGDGCFFVQVVGGCVREKSGSLCPWRGDGDRIYRNRWVRKRSRL